jgi:hypothetical protein
MMDFSSAKIHCSIIGFLMCDGREKTPQQLYGDAIQSRDGWQAKYDALTDKLKGMKTGQNIQAKIDAWEDKLAELEPRKDEDALPGTAKSYLKKYYAYLKYGKWSAVLDKGNKYTNKGKLAENDSIDLLSFLDKVELKKNETRLENGFLTGIPDIIVGDMLNASYIYDAKTSWDVETFFDNLDKDLSSLYWWQIQGYMALTNCQRGEVSYCLVNTPDVLLEGEKYALLRRFDVVTEEAPEFKVAYKELVNNMTFDDIPIEHRRLKFTIERDEEAIQRVYKRVKLARKYMQRLQDMHMNGVFDAKTSGSMDSEDNMPA